MAIYTTVLDTSFNYPNIDMYQKLSDGVLYGYRAIPHSGYVIYSQSTDVITSSDPFTGEEVTEIYYCRQANFPKNYNFDNFDYIAVLESEVPADHIFGDNEPDHEVM